MNKLETLNSYNLVDKLVNKHDLIVACMVNEEDLEHYKLEYEINHRFLMILKYKYSNFEVKESIILQIYSVYEQDNTINTKLVREEVFWYDYNDDTDYTNYYDYVSEHCFGERFIHEGNVLYKHLDKNNVLDIIFTYNHNISPNDKIIESNKYVYVKRYMVDQLTYALTTICDYDLEEEINFKYYNIVLTFLRSINKYFDIISLYIAKKKNGNYLVSAKVINTLSGQLLPSSAAELMIKEILI